MSFVDALVIRQRMDRKDARINRALAKKIAKGRANMSVKQTGHHNGDPDARPVTASPHALLVKGATA